MEPVGNVHEHRWVEEDLSGARGFESMEILADEPEYSLAFSCEYVRLPPGAHSVTRVEKYNHLLFFVEGSGEITIGETTWGSAPGLVREGQGRQAPFAAEPQRRRRPDPGRVRPTAP
jgi:hypothetical protein